MIKRDITKHFIYKYIWYRLTKECTKNETFEGLSSEDKERVCAEITRKAIKWILIACIVYGLLLFLFLLWVIMPPHRNAFEEWLIDRVQVALQSTQGFWEDNGRRARKRRIIHFIIEMLPIILLYIVPIVLFSVITINILFGKKIKAISSSHR